MIYQRTLKSEIRCTGVGLHSGAKVSMTLRPAPVDSGIRFVRTDCPAETAIVPARWDAVVDTRLCTVLSNSHGTTVRTVEHLMAAFAGLGISNAVVTLDGPEVPAMDGSAAPFTFLIRCAGIIDQAATRAAIRVLKPIAVADGDREIVLYPASVPSFTVTIAFQSRAIGRQSLTYRLADGTFDRDLARARTFGFRNEIEALHRAGLARGGSLENAVVIDGDRILNPEGLRCQDEFVRHKLLDALGDMALAGGPVLGHYEGVRAGHALTNALLRALFVDASAWTRVPMGAADAPPRTLGPAHAERLAATA